MNPLHLEELNLFFVDGEFAETVTWQANGQAHSALVNVKAPHSISTAGHHRPVVEAPSLLGPSTLLETLEEDDMVTVRGESYRVTAVVPDGYGLAQVMLCQHLGNAVGDFETWH
jgi:hypothetical protein